MYRVVEGPGGLKTLTPVPTPERGSAAVLDGPALSGALGGDEREEEEEEEAAEEEEEEDSVPALRVTVDATAAGPPRARRRHQRGAAAASSEPVLPGAAALGTAPEEDSEEYRRRSASFRSADLSFLGKLQNQLRALPKVEAGRSSFVGYGSVGGRRSRGGSSLSGSGASGGSSPCTPASPAPPADLERGEVEMDDDELGGGGALAAWREDARAVDEAVDVRGAGVFARRAAEPGDTLYEELPFAAASAEDAAALPPALRDERDPPLPLEPEQLALLLRCLEDRDAAREAAALRERTPDAAVEAARDRFEELRRLFSGEAGGVAGAPGARVPPQSFFALATAVRLYAFEGALYRAGTRMRHSCEPSCEWRVDPDTRRLTVEAVRAVDAGEEATISYFQGNRMFSMMPQRRRQMMINSCGHGFKCACDKCA